MILTDEQRKQFEALSRPMIEWLNNNCHPHVKVVIDSTSAEIVEGVCAINTDDYIKDKPLNSKRKPFHVGTFIHDRILPLYIRLWPSMYWLAIWSCPDHARIKQDWFSKMRITIRRGVTHSEIVRVLKTG